MGKFCWNSTENVSLTKVPPLSMGGKLLQASKLHIWCINSLLNKCRPYITISGSIQPFKMVKIVPENKCPRVPVWVKGGGCDRYLGNAQIDPTFFKLGLPLQQQLKSHILTYFKNKIKWGSLVVACLLQCAQECQLMSFVFCLLSFLHMVACGSLHIWV